MITGLGSYLFGSKKSAVAVDEQDVDIIVEQLTDDWMIVHNNTKDKLEVDVNFTSDDASSIATTSPSTPTTPMEGSWLVTPPPCFSVAQHHPDSHHSAELTPMENLLIEHPSMSVYCMKPRNCPVSARSRPASNISLRSGTSLTPTQQILYTQKMRIAEVQAAIHAQKVQVVQKSKFLTKAALRRHNKVFHPKTEVCKNYKKKV